MASHFTLLGMLVAIYCSVALASDPSPLQDLCVADPKGPALVHGPASSLFSSLHASVLINGFACKNPKLVQADDFFFSGLHLQGNTSNPVGSKVTPVTVAQIPGLNTLGISLVRLDFAPWGVNPPHTHPRATEILMVVEGWLEVGFVTSNPENRLITTILEKGDVFVFPEGLVHFQRNTGNVSAVAIAGLSSQSPGVITIGNAVFGSNPEIPDDLLAKAFQVDDNTRGRSISNSDAEIIKVKEEGIDKDNDAEKKEDDVVLDHNGKGHELNEDKDRSQTECSQERQQFCRHVSHGYHLVEGKMKHGMEDYLVATCKKMDDHELGLYAIFDGHSGREVAQYLQNNLFDNILNEPDFWTSPKAAVKRAFEATDNDILENVVGSRGGSTAVTAILIDREKLIVANVGDSRAVLCRSGTVKQITVDHEPLREKKLVESKGGFVSKKPGNVPRVDGQLAMTRAFGDERLKDHITSEPDIVIENINENTEFIILASDGLWKVMSSEEAVDRIQGFKNGQEAAEELIKEALSRDSKDDISCIVVMFH
ncbi:hypothetical protein DH2020_032753 [Rehmannia glutinosa]|uniref:PPM-type phosphatase domain-containing protein n=1 Tax=Rehmannia glutinosa TaxID=99300 RepID=A0ABR0VF21_REHGL